tara:strand:+ start:557 stop:859 length:303 start_codon:yes stop_codon:yes gene_type:complete
MSKYVGNLYHPTNSYPIMVYEGFNWWAWFFGCFWFLSKSLYGWALISFVLAFMTFGLSNIYFGFFANDEHCKSLLKKGYLSEQQMQAIHNPENHQKVEND